MNHNVRCGEPSSDVTPRWEKLICDDTVGIDADIERLVGLYQAKHHCTRHKANAELVRRLSFLGDKPDAPLL